MECSLSLERFSHWRLSPLLDSGNLIGGCRKEIRSIFVWLKATFSLSRPHPATGLCCHVIMLDQIVVSQDHGSASTDPSILQQLELEPNALLYCVDGLLSIFYQICRMCSHLVHMQRTLWRKYWSVVQQYKKCLLCMPSRRSLGEEFLHPTVK